MGKVDPTGYEAALAQIPKGQLSERQQRIATGMAMVREGSSIWAAAKACQIPYSTLWGYCNNVTKLDNENAGVQGRDLEALQTASLDVSLIAAEKLRKALEEDDWRHGDLVKAYGVATDKVIAFQERPQADDAQGQSLLTKLIQGHRITIEPAREGDDAVPVEAERIGEGE